MNKRDDIMGLGPFLKTLEQRLERLTKDEICRILVHRGKTLPSGERRGFVAQFESAPPATPERHLADDDTALLADIREFIEDLGSGKYYEGTGFDTETRDYRSYGDESWVEEMDELFDRAGDAYLDGRRSLAAEAYALLLHAFDMENDDGHFCGATAATEMVATDINEAKARYLRALYETTPVMERPRQLLKALHALRYRGQVDAGIKVVLEADTAYRFMDGYADNVETCTADSGAMWRIPRSHQEGDAGKSERHSGKSGPRRV